MNAVDGIVANLTGPPLWGAMAAFGLAIGVMTGLFGVGGGFMIVPLLNLLFGVQWSLAIGSSLASTIGTGAGGAARHMRLRNVEPRAAGIMAAGAIAGAWLGAGLEHLLETALGAGDSRCFDLLMQGLFVALLVVTAYLVWSRADDEPSGSALLQRIRLGPRIDLPRAGLVGVSVVGLLLVGLGVGLFAGLLGIGGGVLFMPVLILVVGLRPHQAVGTSLGVVVFSSIAGTIRHGMLGHVSLPIVMPLLVGSSLGIQMGAWLCQRLYARRLRRFFALLVLAVVCWLAWDFARSLLGR